MSGEAGVVTHGGIEGMVGRSADETEEKGHRPPDLPSRAHIRSHGRQTQEGRQQAAATPSLTAPRLGRRQLVRLAVAPNQAPCLADLARRSWRTAFAMIPSFRGQARGGSRRRMFAPGSAGETGLGRERTKA